MVSNCPPDVYPLLFTRAGLFQAIVRFQEPSPQHGSASPYVVSVHEVYFTQLAAAPRSRQRGDT
jgi:hypothetical protein